MCVCVSIDEGVELPGMSRSKFCPSRTATVGSHASAGSFSNTACSLLLADRLFLVTMNIFNIRTHANTHYKRNTFTTNTSQDKLTACHTENHTYR